jgi:hypothetical protein
MQHNVVTATLIFIREVFRPCTAIIRCPRYAKLFIALVVKTKIKIQIKIQCRPI